MKVGDDRFGKCVVGIPDRIFSNSNPLLRHENRFSGVHLSGGVCWRLGFWQSLRPNKLPIGAEDGS